MPLPTDKKSRLIRRSGVLLRPSSDQRPDERAEQLLASFACIVNELEEAEVDRQLFLRNTPMRA
jgi:hypothetical protein